MNAVRAGPARAAAPLGLSLALAGLLLLRIVWDGAARDEDPLMEGETPQPIAEEMVALAAAPAMPATITLPPPPTRAKPIEVAAPAPVPEPPPPIETVSAAPPAPVPVAEPLRPRAVAETLPDAAAAPAPLAPEPPSEPVVAEPAPALPVALHPQPEPVPQPVDDPAEAAVVEAPRPLSPAIQPAPASTPVPSDPPPVPPEVTIEATVADTPRPLSPASQPTPAPAPVSSDPPVHPAGPPPSPDPVLDETVLAEGRPLLRILEHGSGPVIEIAWPDGNAMRERLYETFTACFGMRVALMDRDGALYAAEGRAGEPWAVNLDHYSGFVRQPAGRLARAERGEAERALANHGGGLRASPVRLFPRRVDALLLGGLYRVVGKGYRGAASIRATYGLDGRRVFVTGVSVDGRPLAGRIDLSLASLARCR